MEIKCGASERFFVGVPDIQNADLLKAIEMAIPATAIECL
jgi:hypothetical protein